MLLAEMLVLRVHFLIGSLQDCRFLPKPPCSLPFLPELSLENAYALFHVLKLAD